MARLSLSLLGPFQATLGGAPVTGFESDKVRALFAYLAVEAHRPHRRDALAGLLWPDWSNRAARTNLRNVLANLRTAIGDRLAVPPHLLIAREAIQFDTASDHWLDVAAFKALAETDPPGVHQLEEAVALYCGRFLEGFFLKDSPVFEDWSLLTRERLQRRALAVLRCLARYHERREDYERALEYAWRQVELEPWQEEIHQQLMRLLALSGQRGAALAQYETCRRLLREELGVEPAEETTRLYEQIRDGALSRRTVGAASATLSPISGAEPPSFLYDGQAVEAKSPLSVARERELVWDGEGRWVQGPQPNKETFPARAEPGIAERIARLDQPLPAARRAASVEEGELTAEVLAQMQDPRTVAEGFVQHRKKMDHKQGLICATLVGNAPTCEKAVEIAGSMQGCPYVTLYVASERLVVGVFAIPVSKQWWIEYPQERPELLGLEKVLVHVTEHVEASSPWTRGEVEPSLFSAPCGTACSQCPMYTSRCDGCPATIWYAGG